MSVCGAKTRGGGTCKNAGMPNGRCRMHGGATPSGFALPHTKTGRYSKYLPTRLAADFQRAQADDRLLELRDDIALIDARLSDVLQRVDTGESGAIWTALQDAHKAFMQARAAADVAKMNVALLDMESLIVRGVSDYAAWSDVRSLVEQRRKLVESERKRLVELQQTMTAERALLLLGAATNGLRESVMRHCHDDPQRAQRILTDASAAIRGLVSAGPSRVLDTASADE